MLTTAANKQKHISNLGAFISHCFPGFVTTCQSTKKFKSIRSETYILIKHAEAYNNSYSALNRYSRTRRTVGSNKWTIGKTGHWHELGRRLQNDAWMTPIEVAHNQEPFETTINDNNTVVQRKFWKGSKAPMYIWSWTICFPPSCNVSRACDYAYRLANCKYTQLTHKVISLFHVLEVTP